MKNNTKIRLHLSKQLFETLTKQVIAEGKANDGYSVAVKQPKTPKQSKAQATSPEVQKTDAESMMGEAGAPPIPPVSKKSAVDKLNLAGANMEIKDAKTFAKAILDIAEKLKSKEGFKPESNPNIKRAMDALRTVSSGAPGVPPMPEKKPGASIPKVPPVPGKMEEMSSKEKMKKGLYKEDAGALQPGENVSWLDGNQKEYKGVIQSQEGGDYYKVKITAAPAGGHKVGDILTKQSGDLKKAVAEGGLDEISSEMDLLQQAAPILGTILGVGGTFLATYVKALKSAKTPEEKEKLKQAIRNQMNKSKGF